MLELLMVIGVVAILAVVSFLGTRAVIASAKTSSCASNLHQIGLGLALYAHDSDERYPPYTFQGGSRDGVPGHGLIQATPKAFKRALKGYKVDDAQFYCPLDVHARTDYPGEFSTHLDTSYEMSIDYYNHGKWEHEGFAFTPVGLSDPTQVNVFDDMGEVTTDPEGKRVRTTAHGLRSNVLRADGSVANLPVVQP